MRFMVLVKSTTASEAGAQPSAELLQAMGSFNQGLVDDGMMIDGAGLHPSSRGVRIEFDEGGRRVVPGPFAGELLAGYWLLEAASLEAVVERFKDCPSPHPGERTHIEVRKLFEPEDFTNASPELVAAERDFLDRMKRA